MAIERSRGLLLSVDARNDMISDERFQSSNINSTGHADDLQSGLGDAASAAASTLSTAADSFEDPTNKFAADVHTNSISYK